MENQNNTINLSPDEKVLYHIGRSLLPRPIVWIGKFMVFCLFAPIYICAVEDMLIGDFWNGFVFAIAFLPFVFIFIANIKSYKNHNDVNKIVITNKGVHWSFYEKLGHLKGRTVCGYIARRDIMRCYFHNTHNRGNKTYLVIVPKEGEEIMIMFSLPKYSIKKIIVALNHNHRVINYV